MIEPVLEPASVAADPPPRRDVHTVAARTDEPAMPAVPAGAPPISSEREGAAARARFSALSVAAGGVVMLVDGASSRRDLRLATDLLAAACGDWRVRAVSRRFDWPVASGDDVASATDGGRAALHAFVDKDLTDQDARLLLCAEGLADMLTGGLPDCRRIVIPPLDVLGREAEAKRDLWRALRE